MQNFESEKLVDKIFAKNAQNHAKFAKMPKISQKGQTPLKKTLEKNTKKCT